MKAKKLGIALAIGWLSLPFVACAGAFVIWRSDTFWLALVFITICIAIGFNAVSRRLTPETIQTDPVDRYFEYAPQNAFGFPFPHYRVFDHENPDGDYVIGKTFFDFTSLLGNVTFWTLPVYLLTAIAFTTLPKHGEQSFGHEALDQTF